MYFCFIQKTRPLGVGHIRGGLVFSVLHTGSSSWVWALAGDIGFCSWARQCLSPPRCINGYHWERKEQKYSYSPCVTETGISSGLMSHLARMQTLPTCGNLCESTELHLKCIFSSKTYYAMRGSYLLGNSRF